MLVSALKAAAAALREVAAANQALTKDPLRIEIAIATSTDQTEAEAVKRGQRPELISALRKAL